MSSTPARGRGRGTYYLLPTTYYLLPTTYCLLSTTHYRPALPNLPPTWLGLGLGLGLG